MAQSPLVKKMDYISYTILVDGKEINNDYDILTIDVDRKINKIGQASFMVLLPVGENDNDSFAPSEAKEFMPGKAVEIKVGYESDNKTIFKGLISRQRVKVRAGKPASMEVVCSDKALKMTLGAPTKAFVKQKDNAIISSIISSHGLTADVEATNYEYSLLIQSATNDWDFILNRAQANGLLVYTENDKVSVKKPEASGAADLEINYAESVFDFDGELDSSFQTPGAEFSGWDFKTQEFVKLKSKKPSLNKQGNVKAEKIASEIGFSDDVRLFTTPLESAELEALSDAEVLRSRLTLLRGRVSFFGNALPKLNSLIELKGFGARFNGLALISSIKHAVFEGTWRTEVGFGLPPTLSAASPIKQNSLFPGIEGLQNGLVKKIDKDPDGQHRILVTIPTLGTDVWARQSTFYATQDQGVFFVPEVGDEVVVGFLNNDPRFAILLGSLYSSKTKPAYTADEKNSIKAITTKAGLKLELNDDEKIFTLETPGKNTLILDDKAKEVTVKDQNGNSIVMSSSGIVIKSGKDITIDASGKINLKGATGIDGQASGGDVKFKGLNFTGQGDVGATVKGGAQAELSAGGQTTVKGAMVMIN